jgi:hypothetical protein
VIKLIHGLNHHFDLPKRQIEFGVKKAEKYVMEDLVVDVPHAPKILGEFLEKMKNVTFIENPSD